MSKWKQSYESGRKYKEKWEKQFSWLEKMSNGTENAFCKLCCKILQPKLSTLLNHSKTGDHIRQEEFYQLELANEQNDSPPCKMLRLPSSDDLSFDEDWSDPNETFDESKIFGMWVTNQLRCLKSNDNRNRLKELIKKVIKEISDLDSGADNLKDDCAEKGDQQPKEKCSDDKNSLSKDDHCLNT